MIERIVSGGQSGVDRAALDAALERGIAAGGWCPRGRLAEDGPIDARYPLCETPAARHEQRTEWNVRDSDATLILARGPLSGGTAFTLRCAGRYGRPVRVVDLATSTPPRADTAVDVDAEIEATRTWLAQHRIAVLNVAGPRESGAPGIHTAALAWLRELLARL